MKSLYYFDYIKKDTYLNSRQRFFIQYWLRQLDRRITLYERTNIIGVRFLVYELIESILEFNQGNMNMYDILEVASELKFELQNHQIIARIDNSTINNLVSIILKCKEPNKIIDKFYQLNDLLIDFYQKQIWIELDNILLEENYNHIPHNKLAILSDYLLQDIIFLDYPLEFIKNSHFVLSNPKKNFLWRFNKFKNLICNPKKKDYKLIYKLVLENERKFIDSKFIKVVKEVDINIKSEIVKFFLKTKQNEFLIQIFVEDITSVSASFKGFDQLQTYLDIFGYGHSIHTNIDEQCLVINEGNYELRKWTRLYLGFESREAMAPKFNLLLTNKIFDTYSIEQLQTILRNYRMASRIEFPIWIRFLMIWQSVESLGRTGGLKQYSNDICDRLATVFVLQFYHSIYTRFLVNLKNAEDYSPKIRDILKLSTNSRISFSKFIKLIDRKDYYMEISDNLTGVEIFVYDFLKLKGPFNDKKAAYEQVNILRSKIYWSLKRSSRVRNLLSHKSKIYLSQNQLQFLIAFPLGVFDSIIGMSFIVMNENSENSYEKMFNNLYLKSKKYLDNFKEGRLDCNEIFYPFSDELLPTYNSIKEETV